jgi:hypothetical protein
VAIKIPRSRSFAESVRWDEQQKETGTLASAWGSGGDVGMLMQDLTHCDKCGRGKLSSTQLRMHQIHWLNNSLIFFSASWSLFSLIMLKLSFFLNLDFTLFHCLSRFCKI